MFQLSVSHISVHNVRCRPVVSVLADSASHVQQRIALTSFKPSQNMPDLFSDMSHETLMLHHAFRHCRNYIRLAKTSFPLQTKPRKAAIIYYF